MALTKQDLTRIVSHVRPLILQTVERLNRTQTREDFAGRGIPDDHGETHADNFLGTDPVLAERLTKLCVNDTASIIPIHSVVAIVGVGVDLEFGESRPSVEPADATDANLLPPYGITLAEMAASAAGVAGEARVLLIGEERGVDLVTLGSGTWLAGDELYLDHSTPGGMTKVLPVWPVYRIATVLAYEDTLGDDDQDGILLVDVEDVSLIHDALPPTVGGYQKHEAGIVVPGSFASAGPVPNRQRATVVFLNTYTNPVVALGREEQKRTFNVESLTGTGMVIRSGSNVAHAGNVHYIVMEAGGST